MPDRDMGGSNDTTLPSGARTHSHTQLFNNNNIDDDFALFVICCYETFVLQIIVQMFLRLRPVTYNYTSDFLGWSKYLSNYWLKFDYLIQILLRRFIFIYVIWPPPKIRWNVEDPGTWTTRRTRTRRILSWRSDCRIKSTVEGTINSRRLYQR